MNDIAAHIKLILEGTNNASVRMQQKNWNLNRKLAACNIVSEALRQFSLEF